MKAVKLGAVVNTDRKIRTRSKQTPSTCVSIK